MNEATKKMIKLNDKFQDNMYMGGKVALDNEEVIASLIPESTEIRDIMSQETFIMDDGSYITRNDDLYFTGDDITEFELTEIMICSENKIN